MLPDRLDRFDRQIRRGCFANQQMRVILNALAFFVEEDHCSLRGVAQIQTRDTPDGTQKQIADVLRVLADMDAIDSQFCHSIDRAVVELFLGPPAGDGWVSVVESQHPVEVRTSALLLIEELQAFLLQALFRRTIRCVVHDIANKMGVFYL